MLDRQMHEVVEEVELERNEIGDRDKAGERDEVAARFIAKARPSRSLPDEFV